MIETLLQAERLLLHGLVDQAETLYQRTLDADPRNAIALVGLARVALERADDRLAYEHACAALEIDQRNPAALRLEARLSEVLATRGEAVERPAWLAGDAPAPGEPPNEPDAVEQPPEGSAERAAFARNPSMADHRRMQAQRDVPAASPPSEHSPPAGTTRRGLLRRLLGR